MGRCIRSIDVETVDGRNASSAPSPISNPAATSWVVEKTRGGKAAPAPRMSTDVRPSIESAPTTPTAPRKGTQPALRGAVLHESEIHWAWCEQANKPDTYAEQHDVHDIERA